MKIFITGGSGFIGTRLVDFLLQKGHHVIAVGTSATHKAIAHDHFQYISANTTRQGAWQGAVENVGAVINLAGKTIFQYWTKSHKSQIYGSRILTTRHLVEALEKSRGIPIISTSAAGYYGNRGDEILTEDASPGDDFLAHICIDWEKEAFKAVETGARVVVMRLGVVLGKNGGALAKMVPAFKFFAGGTLADGNQWFPWIHMDDLIAAIVFIIENPHINGPVNVCAPDTVKHREFAKVLGSVLNRPSFMPAPSYIIRLFMGEMGTSILNSQRVIPEKLATYGFKFNYPDIDIALNDLLG